MKMALPFQRWNSRPDILLSGQGTLTLFLCLCRHGAYCSIISLANKNISQQIAGLELHSERGTAIFCLVTSASLWGKCMVVLEPCRGHHIDKGTGGTWQLLLVLCVIQNCELPVLERAHNSHLCDVSICHILFLLSLPLTVNVGNAALYSLILSRKPNFLM